MTKFHHLRPTRSRPEMFFTVQKSRAAKMVHKMKVETSGPGRSQAPTRPLPGLYILSR